MWRALRPPLIVIPKLLFPLPATERLYPPYPPFSRRRTRPPAPDRCGLRWRHDDLYVSFPCRVIEGLGVVDSVAREAPKLAGNGPNKPHARHRVIRRTLNQSVREDDSGAIDADVQLESIARSTPATLRGSPFALTNHREPGAVHDLMAALRRRTRARSIEKGRARRNRIGGQERTVGPLASVRQVLRQHPTE